MGSTRVTGALTALVLATSALAAGCGDGGPAASETLVVYGSSGAIEEIMKGTVIPAFEKSHDDVKVVYQGVTSSEALAKSIATREDPEASLVIGNDRDITFGYQEGLWQSISPESVPTISQLVPDSVGDDGHSVALSVAANGIAYNATILEEEGIEPPTSWLDLFDERFAHRAVIYDYALGGTPQYVYMINQALGGKPDDFGPALELLEEHRDDILAFPTDTAQWDQLFAQGTAWVGPTSSARVGIARESGLDLRLADLEEGMPAFRIQAAIPAEAPRSEAGAEFLDFLLQPEQQELIARSQFYAPVNPQTELDPETQDLVPDPESLLNIDNSILLRIHEDVSQRWQSIVSE